MHIYIYVYILYIYIYIYIHIYIERYDILTTNTYINKYTRQRAGCPNEFGIPASAKIN